MVLAADTGAQTNAWRQCAADSSVAAIDACTLVIFLDPRNDGAFVNRGIAYRRAGEIVHALRDYDTAIQLNPSAADAFNNRGNAYRDLHALDKALRDYDEAIRLDPGYAHAYNNRGIVMLEMNEPAFAVADFDRAIVLEPEYANALRNRGLAYTDLRQFDRAIENFDDAFRLDTSLGRGAEYALALFGRGVTRRNSGDPRGENDLDQARRLLPNVAAIMAAEGIR